MAKKLVLLGSVLSIAGILLLVARLEHARDATLQHVRTGVFNPADIEAEYLRRLGEVESGSPAARQLLRDIEKVRKKANQTYLPSENAGAFQEALVQLKTARDGTRYSRNYKAKELRKARRVNTDFSKRSRDKLSAQDVLPWRERGPGNVSGRARAIVVDYADPSGNTWFVATTGGGVWKTTNAGASWEHKTPDITVYSTNALAQSKSNPDVLYVGTGMGYGRVVELVGNGVWKSTDHGETWNQLQSTANGELLEAVNRIVVDPKDADVVLLCSNESFAHLYPKGGQRKSGIFRTTNGGQTWTQVYDPDLVLGTRTDNRIQQIIANPLDFNTLYASVNEFGVIRSTNGGLSWLVSAGNFALAGDVGNPSSGGFGLAGISVRSELAIAPSDTGRIYAAVERPRGIADLYMSKNSGQTWSLVNDTSGDPNWFNSFGVSGATGAYTAGWFDNTIAVHPFDENVVFVGGVNMYRLDVNPNNATRTSRVVAFWLGGFNASRIHADHHDLKMIVDNSATGSFRVLDANDGGVAISEDGGESWRGMQGQNTTQFYAVEKKPGEDIYIGGMQDNHTYHSGPNPDANSQWIQDLGGDGFEAAWNPRDPNLVLATAQNGSYFRSETAALTWAPLPAARAGFAPFISKIGYSKTDPDLVFTVGSAGVNRSDDFGESWVLTPITGNWLGYRPFDNVEVSSADPRVVWISSRMDVDPPIGFAGGIHVSADGGITYTQISQNFPLNVTEASGIATHPDDAHTAYFLFSAPGRSKILRTADLGRTFQDISGFGGTGQSNNGFPDVAVFSLLVMPFNTDILWAGTEIGLFVSEDGGASWNLADNGFPTVSIFEMKVRDNQILMATYGRGIWTVEHPALANYSLPEVTLTPRLKPLAQDLGSGVVVAEIDLRSEYDSTKVFMNGHLLTSLGPTEAGTQRSASFSASITGPVSMSVSAFKNGEAYSSATRRTTVVPVPDPVSTLSLDFDSQPLQNAVVQGFSVATAANFPDAALHTQHPYPNGAEQIVTLTTPIRLSSGTITYDEVVLVEPGLPQVTDSTDPNFFDYCIVEGSLNGIDWRPLIPGYDSRDDPAWVTAYNQGASGTSTLYRTRTINVPGNLFAAGSNVFIRFRLLADPGANGWGWAIDNLQVQGVLSSVDDNYLVPRSFALSQNYPNPFNPTTKINYALPERSDVTLTIYNVVGRQVRALKRIKNQAAGKYAVEWDGKDESGLTVATGLYVYRIEATGNTNKFVESRKMLFVK